MLLQYCFRGFIFTDSINLKQCKKKSLLFSFHKQKKKKKSWGKKVIKFVKYHIARFRDKIPTQPIWFQGLGL